MCLSKTFKTLTLGILFSASSYGMEAQLKVVNYNNGVKTIQLKGGEVDPASVNAAFSKVQTVESGRDKYDNYSIKKDFGFGAINGQNFLIFSDDGSKVLVWEREKDNRTRLATPSAGIGFKKHFSKGVTNVIAQGGSMSLDKVGLNLNNLEIANQAVFIDTEGNGIKVVIVAKIKKGATTTVGTFVDWNEFFDDCKTDYDYKQLKDLDESGNYPYKARMAEVLLLGFGGDRTMSIKIAVDEVAATIKE